MIHIRSTEALPGGRVRFTLESDEPGVLVVWNPVPKRTPHPSDPATVVAFIARADTWRREGGANIPNGSELLDATTRQWVPRVELQLVGEK